MEKKLKPILIGVAGGSGAGKSTLCTSLMDAYPHMIGMIQLDDYFKKGEDAPLYNGHLNWEHPEALFFEKFVQDLARLASGETIRMSTKNERLNPSYSTTGERITVDLKPTPIILVEGYLVLHDERARKLFTTSLWLDAGHETRWGRRVHFKNEEYKEKVLIPMHAEFVEPTKKYATHVIAVQNVTKEEVFEKSKKILAQFLEKTPN